MLGKACPLFVPLVEEGLWEDPVTDEIAGRYLAELIDIDIDTLILGCTHYPLIRSTVGRIMGEKVTLVNPAYETARELKEVLQKKGLESDTKPELGTERYRFFVMRLTSSENLPIPLFLMEYFPPRQSILRIIRLGRNGGAK